jgi:hypothetical protein
MRRWRCGHGDIADRRGPARPPQSFRRARGFPTPSSLGVGLPRGAADVGTYGGASGWGIFASDGWRRALRGAVHDGLAEVRAYVNASARRTMPRDGSRPTSARWLARSPPARSATTTQAARTTDPSLRRAWPPTSSPPALGCSRELARPMYGGRGSTASVHSGPMTTRHPIWRERYRGPPRWRTLKKGLVAARHYARERLG